MDSNYKLAREQFISNHNGTSFQEVLALTTIGQLSNFLLISILYLFVCESQTCRFDINLVDLNNNLIFL